MLWREGKALFPTEVILPPQYDPAEPHTLVVALHGYGSTAEAFRRSTKPFTEAGFVVALPEASYAVTTEDGELGYDWWLYQYPEDEKLHFRAASLLVGTSLPALVEDLCGSYGADHVYLFGFSQGALTSFMLGLTKPDLVDGIIAFGGMASADWYPGDTLENASGVPVLMVQGTSDERIPLAWAKSTVELLQANGNEVTFRTFEGGHLVPPGQVQASVTWIKQHQQPAPPDAPP
jgi:phospholipase/carboxylesterase